MKIIIIGTAYPLRGGIAHYNALLFKTLRARGHDVHVISFSRQYPALFFPGKTQKDLGEDTIPVDAEPILDSISPFSWIRVAHRVRQYEPDLIIFKYWMPFFAPCYAAVSFFSKLWSKTRVLYVCDNIIPHEHRPIDGLLTRVGLAYVDYYLVMSDTVRLQLLRYRPDARYREVSHPVYDIFGKSVPKMEARKRLGLGNERLILFFGYVRRYKGLGVLLEAMPHILRRVDVRLLVAGEFYDDKAPYIQQIKRLGIEKNVTLLDEYISSEEVRYYYSAADVVALPYISATQSGIVQICYNFNKPVIATDVGGLPEVVLDGETGYVVPAEDPEAFAEAVVRFYLEANTQVFARNIEKEKKKYSWERLAESIESLCGAQVQ